MDFLIGGMAAVGAGFFTNPLEVIKTRMQLQGELSAKGKHAIFYRNVVHAAYMVAKHDGILALQNGLTPALLVQLVLNGVRLGAYQYADNVGLMSDKNGERVFYKGVIGAGLSATMGQFACTPLFIVKTHQQSQASSAIAVGHQHEKQGMVKAMVNIYKANGIPGLFRNAGAGFPRAFVGCSAQLTSFEYSKTYLLRYEWLRDKPLIVSFLGSMVGGVAISVMMTPFELVLTRLLNQPLDDRGKGKTYSSYMDCVSKIYKAEGPSAFFKGIGPMYLRLGPHTVLVLVFWDELKLFHDKYFARKNID